MVSEAVVVFVQLIHLYSFASFGLICCLLFQYHYNTDFFSCMFDGYY